MRKVDMHSNKTEILNEICYTELVYERINKKLHRKFSKDDIEKMIFDILKETNELQFQKTGKNIYVTNYGRNIRITINSNTHRIITVDELNKKKTTNPRLAQESASRNAGQAVTYHSPN